MVTVVVSLLLAIQFVVALLTAWTFLCIYSFLDDVAQYIIEGRQEEEDS